MLPKDRSLDGSRNRDADEIDDALEVLSDRNRRRILRYLADEPCEWTTVANLSTHLASQVTNRTADPSEVERSLEVRLRHVHLPKLRQNDLVEYDAQSGEVRYTRNQFVEEFLSFLLSGK